MGVFDKSICDCCVCPMQCVLEQLKGERIRIGFLSNQGSFSFSNPTNVNRVENFILFTDSDDYAIHTIDFIILDFVPDPQIQLKPIKNSLGECACIEGPMTNLLESRINQTVRINRSIEVNIVKVGQGIVSVKDIVASADNFPFGLFSTCSISQIRI
ncbi:hypothetical protein VQL36_13250 [Chengkuizengella sp. SCS-71B]|uniref:hypothetical protein n=1 Tax=Chengkuizengella sp. SCS-71B TaxID=3115290 RepID=UPI0032C2272C